MNKYGILFGMVSALGINNPSYANLWNTFQPDKPRIENILNCEPIKIPADKVIYDTGLEFCNRVDEGRGIYQGIREINYVQQGGFAIKVPRKEIFQECFRNNIGNQVLKVIYTPRLGGGYLTTLDVNYFQEIAKRVTEICSGKIQ